MLIDQKCHQNIYPMTVSTPFAVGPINTYIIEGEKLTLVDCGPKTKKAWDHFVQQLAELGKQPEDIEQVVLTHHHPDHVGFLEYFQLDRIRILGHHKNKPWLIKDHTFFTQYIAFFEQLYKRLEIEASTIESMIRANAGLFQYYAEARLDVELKEGDEIPGLPCWKVYETPGHASSHIVLFREEDGLMIGGDHLIGHISSNAIIEPPYPGEYDRPKTLVQYRQSLEKCLNLDIHTVLPGHGEKIQEPHTLIKKRLKEQEKRAARIKKLVSDQDISFTDICFSIFPHPKPDHLFLIFSEILGHLDLLEARGEVETYTTENGCIRYREKEK